MRLFPSWPALAALCLSGAACIVGNGMAAEAEASAAGTLTIPLEYREVSYPVHSVSLRVDAQKDPFEKEPVVEKNLLRRGKLRLPGQQQKSVNFIWTPTRLYLDLNANGDLTDDPSGVYTNFGGTSWSSGNYRSGHFNKVKLSLSLEKGEVPWLAQLSVSEFDQRNGTMVYASSYSYWSGKVTLNGKPVELGWIPAGTKAIGSRGHEYMLLRTADSPQNSFSTSDGSLRTFDFPARLFYNGTLYKAGIESENQGQDLKFRLALSPEKSELGELNITGKYVQRVLLAGEPCVAVFDSPGATIKLPQGRYGSVTVQVGNGTNFVYPKQPMTRSVNVSAGSAAQVVAGGPLTNIVKVTRNNDYLLLSYELVGAGGAEFNEWDRTTPPKFVVYKDGKQIDTGNFEYG